MSLSGVLCHLGALLLGVGATAGYCIFGLTGLAHTAALPPVCPGRLCPEPEPSSSFSVLPCEMTAGDHQLAAKICGVRLTRPLI